MTSRCFVYRIHRPHCLLQRDYHAENQSGKNRSVFRSFGLSDRRWPVPLADVAAQQSAPGAEYAPDAVLVQFAPSADTESAAAAEAASGGEIIREFSLVPGLTYMRLPLGADVIQTIEKLKGIDGIVYAEPDYVVYPTDTISNDTRWAEQWAFATVRAPLAWDVTTGAADVVIAVIDTGVDTTHPDLINNLWTNPGEIARQRHRRRQQRIHRRYPRLGFLRQRQHSRGQ